MTVRRHPLAGAALTTLAALGFSTVPAFAKTIYDADSNALGVMTVRFTLAAAIMLAARSLLARGEGRPLPRDAGLMVAAGAIGVTAVSLMYFIAIGEIDTSLGIVIWYGYPVTVVAYTWLVWRRRPSRAASLALVGSVAGVALAAGERGARGTGTAITLIILSAICFGAYIIVLQRLVGRMGFITGVTLLNAGSALGYWIVCLLPLGRLGMPADLEPVWPVSGRAFALVAILAVVGTAVPFMASMAGLRMLDPTSYSILMTIEPVIAVVVGVTFLGEGMTARRLVGAVLVIGALVAYTAAESRRSAPVPDAHPGP